MLRFMIHIANTVKILKNHKLLSRKDLLPFFCYSISMLEKHLLPVSLRCIVNKFQMKSLTFLFYHF